MQQQQQEFNELLNTLMESVEKFQAGDSGEGNYLVAMNCLRSLHGFGGRVGDDGCEGRLRGLVDDLQTDLGQTRDELERLRDWNERMSTYSYQPEWCKRCGSWDTDFDQIKETDEYGYLCFACREDLDCLDPAEVCEVEMMHLVREKMMEDKKKKREEEEERLKNNEKEMKYCTGCGIFLDKWEGEEFVDRCDGCR